MDNLAEDIPVGPLAEQLGIELTTATPDEVVGTVEVGEQHHQPFGIMNGGLSMVLAETIASIGANISAPDGKQAVGLEINANHIHKVKQAILTGRAQPHHKGQTTQIWEVDIRTETDKKVSVSRCTLYNVDADQSGLNLDDLR